MSEPEVEPPDADGAARPKKRGRPKKIRSVDDIAAKHADRPAPARRAPAVPPPRDDDPPPSDEEPDAHTPFAAVPPNDSRPQDRTRPTIGEIRVDPEYQPADMSTTERPKTLTELVEYFPIGIDPAFWIRVERTQPKRWDNFPVAGFIEELRDRISENEFWQRYGGQKYKLQVFGPDPRGRRGPDGMVRKKALTDIIEYDVPIPDPNMEALPVFSATQEERADTMQRPFNSVFGRGTTSTADAEIHRTSVGVLERQLQRQEQEADALRTRLDRQSGLASVQPIVDFIGQQSSHSIDALRRQSEESERRNADRIAKLEQELAEARKQPPPEKQALSGVAEVLRELKPNGASGDQMQILKAELESLKHGHQQALDRLETKHKDELNRVLHDHRDQITRLESSHRDTTDRMKAAHQEELKRIEDDRNRERSRHGEQLESLRNEMGRRENDLRSTSERATASLKESYEARIAALKESYEARIKDEDKNHEREMRAMRESWESRLHTEGSTAKVQIRVAEEEARRARDEAERARAKAEEAGDLPRQIEKFATVAEHMGWKKDEGEGSDEPKTWQEGLARAAMTVAANAPETVRAIGDTVRQLRGQPQQMPPGVQPQMVAPGQVVAIPQQQGSPRQIRAPGGRPMAVRPLPLATSDGPDIAPEFQEQGAGQSPLRTRVVAQPQQQYAQQYAQQPIPQVPVQPMQQQPMQPPMQQPMQQPMQPMQPMQQQPQQPPMQQQPPQPPQQGMPVQQSGIGPPFDPAAMEQFRQRMELSIIGGMAPEEFAGQFVQMFPAESKQMVQWIQPDVLFEALSKAQATSGSPIVQRNGQKWTRAMWAAVEKAHGIS